MGLPGDAVVKNLPANAGDSVLIPGWGRPPWRRKCQPTPVLLPGKSYGQRNLKGYSPWSCKEEDMTEREYRTCVGWWVMCVSLQIVTLLLHLCSLWLPLPSPSVQQIPDFSRPGVKRPERWRSDNFVWITEAPELQPTGVMVCLAGIYLNVSIWFLFLALGSLGKKQEERKSMKSSERKKKKQGSMVTLTDTSGASCLTDVFFFFF